MHRFYKCFLLVIWIFIGKSHTSAQQSPLKVWYDKPARQWEECIPLGNGRLGAMPDGGILKENITLNDITLWSGGVQNADSPEAAAYLPQIRQLLFDGKNDEAQSLMYKSFVCTGPGSGEGRGSNVAYGSYEVLGNLHLEYDYNVDSAAVRPTEYKRELSLNEAIAKTVFKVNGITYTREYFVSFDHDAIVIRITAEKSGNVNVALTLDRPEKFLTNAVGDELRMEGQLNNGTDGKGMRYVARVKMKAEGGSFRAVNNKLRLQNADAVTIYVSTATDYRNPGFLQKSAEDLAGAFHAKYTSEKTAHSKKYQELFNRTALTLGNDDKSSLPTDERLKAFTTNPADPGLASLYFQFGRYLLICSTRPGLIPPNLQGLWANTIQTPWNGDYHLNINIQMNHWPLNIANLPMLNEPFYELVAGLVEPGKKTAKVYYDAEGWVAHVITNVWGYTSPGEHPSWGSFNTGSAWLCQMLWTHYAFTNDKLYLEKIYPVLRGSAEFYLNTLVKDHTTGWLVTSPSNSPENAFLHSSGKAVHVCMAPTIDNQIIRALFSYMIEASGELKRDEGLRTKLKDAIKDIPPNQIGKDGRLMEWLQEYQEVDPNHRHVSHLWGLYPGDEISPGKTPELAKAARASLERRGDDGTGWSLAWKINLWARLYDGERAYKILQRFFRPTNAQGFDMKNGGGTYANLFCAHPPFQIDGNFGATAGIAEMLLQSHNGYLEFLPALPDAWATGSFAGFCTRGGATVDALWENKKLLKATITGTADNHFEVKVPPSAQVIRMKKDQKVSNLPVTNSVKFHLKKGERIEITFQDK